MRRDYGRPPSRPTQKSPSDVQLGSDIHAWLAIGSQLHRLSVGKKCSALLSSSQFLYFALIFYYIFTILSSVLTINA